MPDHEARTNPDGAYRLQVEAAIDTLREAQTALVCELGKTQREMRELRTWLGGHKPMSAAAIKAWGITVSAILTALIAGLTQWRVAQAGAESRRGAEVAAAQATDRRNEVDRQRLAETTAETASRRTAEYVRQAVREEQASAERRAEMRVAPGR